MTFDEWYEDSCNRYLNTTIHFGLEHDRDTVEAALREAFEAGQKASGETSN
jgi:hypothetical protein